MKSNVPDPDEANVRILSEKFATLIRECLEARALHPAAIIGVLAYHTGALSASTQTAFMTHAKPVPTIVTPPAGFKLPPP